MEKDIRMMAEGGYGGVEFLFEVVERENGTRPVRRFSAEWEMGFEELIAFCKTGTRYQRARVAGVEVLTE